ncbi:helix-turn-helix domain-containing protein [Streptomyces sp. NPDC054802]|jgi:transcriptional regulator with XRE-family HTH domain
MKPRIDPTALTRRRVLAGLNQSDLAERAGISKSHVSMVENGQSGLSARALGQVARALGCDIADLLLDEEPAASAGSPA